MSTCAINLIAFDKGHGFNHWCYHHDVKVTFLLLKSNFFIFKVWFTRKMHTMNQWYWKTIQKVKSNIDLHRRTNKIQWINMIILKKITCPFSPIFFHMNEFGTIFLQFFIIHFYSCPSTWHFFFLYHFE